MVPASVAELAQTYVPRRATFLSEEPIGPWRLKLYGLADPATGLRPALIARTLELAAEHLPADGGYGAAFAIAHDAACPIALVSWWQGVNELHQRVFAGDTAGSLALIEREAAGCVYELGIIDFERRAWIEDVMGNPAGPDLDAYLQRRFDGMV
jgi:hypothetical protein